MSYGSFTPEARRGSAVRLIAAALAGCCLFVAGLGMGYDRGLKDRLTGRSARGPMETETSSTGRVFGVGEKPPTGFAKDVDFSQFWQTWEDLKRQYYKQPVDERAMYYGALRGMTDALQDPYTNFFEPKQAEDFASDLKGEFSGIGAEIGVKNNELRVITPLPGSPAEKAGVKAGDLILKINDEDSIFMPVDLAVSKIRGPKGTEVHLKLGHVKKEATTGTKRELEQQDVTIIRDVITVKSVRVVAKDNGVFVIEIRSFNEDTTTAFRDAVDEVAGKNAKGIILDLRNDPGGFLDRAIAVAGEWVRDDVVVEQRERGKITEQYKGNGRGKLKGIKTVVLVNEGSASASEIVAGALQDYGVATLVGMKTFGKGSVQDYVEYDDGSALKVTIAEWLTPQGRSINHEGIKPDVEVDRTPEDINADRDPQLEKALELLRTGQAKP